MYRHVWESVLGFSNNLSDLARASRICRMALSATLHMKPCNFFIECGLSTLKNLSTIKTSCVLRHIVCRFMPLKWHAEEMVRMANQKGIAIAYICRSSYDRYVRFIVETSTTLVNLDLTRACIGSSGTAVLANSLKSNTSIHTLYLDRNGICDEGVFELVNMLKLNTHITTIGLGNNGITNVGAVVLADRLNTNKFITHLNLNNNAIGDEGAIALANAVKASETMRVMALCGCLLQHKGIRALTDAFKGNIHMKCMCLSSNNLDGKGRIVPMYYLRR